MMMLDLMETFAVVIVLHSFIPFMSYLFVTCWYREHASQLFRNEELRKENDDLARKLHCANLELAKNAETIEHMKEQVSSMESFRAAEDENQTNGTKAVRPSPIGALLAQCQAHWAATLAATSAVDTASPPAGSSAAAGSSTAGAAGSSSAGAAGPSSAGVAGSSSDPPLHIQATPTGNASIAAGQAEQPPLRSSPRKYRLFGAGFDIPASERRSPRRDVGAAVSAAASLASISETEPETPEQGLA